MGNLLRQADVEVADSGLADVLFTAVQQRVLIGVE